MMELARPSIFENFEVSQNSSVVPVQASHAFPMKFVNRFTTWITQMFNVRDAATLFSDQSLFWAVFFYFIINQKVL